MKSGMGALSHSATNFNIARKFSHKIQSPVSTLFPTTLAFTSPFTVKYNNNLLSLSCFISCVSSYSSTARSAVPASTASSSHALSATSGERQHHWMVQMESPLEGLRSKAEIIDYYVRTLETVLGRWLRVLLC